MEAMDFVAGWNYVGDQIRDRRILYLTNRLLAATKMNSPLVAELPDHRFIYRGDDMPEGVEEVRLTTMTDIVGRGIMWSRVETCANNPSHRNGQTMWCRSDGEVLFRRDRYSIAPDYLEQDPDGQFRPFRLEFAVKKSILQPMGLVADYLEHRVPPEEMIPLTELDLNV